MVIFRRGWRRGNSECGLSFFVDGSRLWRMSVATMFRRQTEHDHEDDERDRALFLAGQDKHPESFAQAHCA